MMARREFRITWNSVWECYDVRLASLELLATNLTIVEARRLRKAMMKYGRRAISDHTN